MASTPLPPDQVREPFSASSLSPSWTTSSTDRPPSSSTGPGAFSITAAAPGSSSFSTLSMTWSPGQTRMVSLPRTNCHTGNSATSGRAGSPKRENSAQRRLWAEFVTQWGRVTSDPVRWRWDLDREVTLLPPARADDFPVIPTHIHQRDVFEYREITTKCAQNVPTRARLKRCVRGPSHPHEMPWCRVARWPLTTL
jgi:hypothetical protein